MVGDVGIEVDDLDRAGFGRAAGERPVGLEEGLPGPGIDRLFRIDPDSGFGGHAVRVDIEIDRGSVLAGHFRGAVLNRGIVPGASGPVSKVSSALPTVPYGVRRVNL